jgi:hypothetical protein
MMIQMVLGVGITGTKAIRKCAELEDKPQQWIAERNN